ncbi:MAG: undecaprenyl-diphosphatase UppP [Anaerolineae bacterium]
MLQALVLGLVQGATEFLPISSSAHLVLVPWLLHWPDFGLAFDTTLHLGTLVAVVTYFRRDLAELVVAWWASLRERTLNPDPQRKLAWLILVGTIPAALLGLLFEDFFEALFSAPLWVAGLLLVTGALLLTSERLSSRHRSMQQIGWLDAVLIGLAQAVAIAPGISRSGATIAMGLFRGLNREVAARYSFLLATPIILAAGLLKLKDLAAPSTPHTQIPPLIVGFVAAAISGYLGIKLLLSYLQQGKLYIFAAYCWAVGAIALLLILL